MRRIAQTLAVTGAVLAAGLGALPAAASTLAPAGTAQRAGVRHTGTAPAPAAVNAMLGAQRMKAELTQRGAVTGMVYGPHGAPEANVCVQAIGPLGTRTAFTGRSGSFLITGLPVGGYRIEYRGCSPIGRFVGQWYGGLTRASATTVRVLGGAPTELAPVTLGIVSPRLQQQAAARAAALRPPVPIAPGLAGRAAAAVGPASPPGPPAAPGHPASVSGRVTTKSGHPVARVCVLALHPYRKNYDVVSETQTSKSGRYSLRVFPTSFLIDFLPTCARAGNYAPQLWQGAGSAAAATTIRVKPHQSVKNIDAVLGTGAEITGRITVAGSHPSLGGVCVLAVGTGGQRVFDALTNTRADGKFTLPDLATGKYRLSFASCNAQSPYVAVSLPKPVSVTDGKVTTGISAALRVGGKITGTVTDTANNKLAGICVNASMPGDHFFGQTGKTGKYLIEGMPAGQYRMSFGTGCPSNGPYTPRTLKGTVAVSLGTTATVNAVLAIDGSITGTVTSASSAPVGGVCVQVISGPGFGFAITKSNGSYTVRDLPAGQYQLQFIPGGAFSNCGSHGNYLPAMAAGDVSSATSTTVDATLPTGGVIAGVVRDSHGKPLPGICVFSNGRSPFASQIVTNSAGTYRMSQLFTGSYFVGFIGGCGNTKSVAFQAYRGDPTLNGPKAIPVTQGAVTGGINAAMKPGGILAGRVTDQAGKPVSKVCVFLLPATGAGAFGVFGAESTTSRNGTYSATNLPPGQFTVVFSGIQVKHRGCVTSPYADQQFSGVGLGAPGNQVWVPAGTRTDGVNAVLAPSGKISGKVTGTAGRRLNNICVTATDQATHAEGQATAFDGKYVLTDLPAGRYDVEFSNCGINDPFIGATPNYANQWYKNSPVRAKATPVVVTGGHTTANIDAALTPGGGITGHVSFRPNGRPVSFVCVEAYTPDLGSFGIALTDRRGDYSVDGLSTGRYSVAFVPCSFESALAGQVRAGAVSVVAGHTVHGISEQVQVGGSVSGVVSSAASGHGKAAPGTCVEVEPLFRTGLASLAVAGPGGTYLATNLAPGRYRVLFADPGCSNNSPSLSASLSGEVTVVTRGNTTANATLKLAGGITGVVRGSHGPAAGICAKAVPQRGNTLTGVTAAAVGISTAAGHYEILGLQPGRYKVEFTVGCGATGLATRWYKNAASEKNATVVTVKADAVDVGINGTLPRA